MILEKTDGYAPCTCGALIPITLELRELPQGTPIHCPACGKPWRHWQLIVRRNRYCAK